MKKNEKQFAAKILLTLVIGIYHSVPAYALPNQGTLDNSAAASIATQGTTMSITGKGANNILNWATFSIDKGETVKFTDKSNYLNLVRGVDISRIYGTMSGGGTVYLVNPNGILFGQGARLDNVGSFIASTRNISAINQDAFLKNPNDTTAVLGKDSKEMDNKDYYPDALEYTPKISVADIQLTNVPKSATKIILDGPGGVILKDIEILNKVNKVTTRKSGGEIGIGSDDGTISLTSEQTKKIYVVDENKETAFDNNINAELVEGYRKVKDYKDLEYVRNNPGLYVLENNIDAVSMGSDKTSELGITFDGMGYDISNYSGTTGLFSNYQGTIRNVSLSNVNVEASGRREGGNSTGLYSVTVYGTGGIADEFDGIMNNVSVSGKVVGDGAVGGLIGINNVYSYPNLEIYNSHNDAKVSSNGKSHEALALGGIIGAVYYTNYLGKTETYRSVNIRNVYNNGEILLDHSKRADDYTSDSVAIGGIIGEFTTLRGGSHGYSYYSPNYYLESDYNTPRVTILGSYNTGLIESKLAGSSVKAGGIAGYGYIGAIGESFNFGEVHGSDDNCEGGILGKTHTRYVTADADNVKIFKSQQTKQDITAYYLDSTAGENDESFGISVSSSDMKLLFNPAMFGIYNAETIQSKASGTPIDSKSVDPTPVDPTPVDPTPVDPTPVNPAPVNPTPVDPTPVKPTPIDPMPGGEGVKVPIGYNGVITVILNEDKDKQKINIENQIKNNQTNNSGIYSESIDAATKKQIHDKALEVVMDKDYFAEAVDAGKKISKFANKSTGSSIAGFSEKYLAFLNDFYALHNQREGLAGASDVTSLASSSIDLQKEILEIISKMDDNTKSKFFADKQNVKSLGVVSGILGLTSSVMAATDGVDQKRVAVAIADYINVLDSAVTLNKELEKFVNANEKFHIGSSYLKTGSIWSPLDIYSTVASIGIKSSAQLVKSVDKYSADGKWDLKDTGETFIDTSMVGIKTFSNKLTFGLDDLIFGAIDQTGGKVGYVDQAIQGYKILANNIGTAIGNWWIDLTYGQK